MNTKDMIQAECQNFTKLEEAINMPNNSRTVMTKVDAINNCISFCGTLKECCCKLVSDTLKNNNL